MSSSDRRGADGTTAAERSFLGRLAGWCYDHRRRVLVLWILGIIAVTVVAQAVGTRYQNNFSSGNSESQQVQNILAARFPQTAGTTADVVVQTTGAVRAPATVARTDAMVARLRKLPDVSGVTSPFAAGRLRPGPLREGVAIFFEEVRRLPPKWHEVREVVFE